MPVESSLYPVEPSYILLDPGAANTTVSLGTSSVSANISVVASNTAQLVKNPQFYSNPDYWYCYPGSYLSCYWLPSDTGSVGGVAEINGTIPALDYDQALIYQPIVVPNSPIVSAYLYVTVRYALASRVLTDWFVGLYDPSTGNFYSYTYYTTPSSYTTYVIDVSNVIEPGKTYYVVVGVEGLVLSFSGSGSIDFRVDSVYLNITTLYYTFSNTVLGINATSSSSPTVYARLAIDSASLDPGLNATLRLINVSGATTTSIVIVNGSIESADTDWIELSPVQTGYSSGYLQLNVSKQSLVNSTLQLYLEICTGGAGSGACAYYPLQIIIDPLNTRGHGASHVLGNVVALERTDKDRARLIATAIRQGALMRVRGSS